MNFFWINDLKFIERRELIVLIKKNSFYCPFCRHLDSAEDGCCTTPSTLATPLAALNYA